MSRKRPEIGKVAKVYKNKTANNLKVTMVRIGPEDQNEVIIKFDCIDSKYDGMIIRHRVNSWSKGNSFDCVNDVMSDQGREWNALYSRNASYRSIQCCLPDLKPQEHALYFDADESEFTNPEHLLTEYLEQEEEHQGK